MVLRGLSIYRRFRRYKLEFNQNSMAGSRQGQALPPALPPRSQLPPCKWLCTNERFASGKEFES